MTYYIAPGIQKRRPYRSGLAFTSNGVRITNIVADYFGYSLKDICSHKRDGYLVSARQYIFFLLRKYTQISLAGIGEYFGGRDHSTIGISVKTFSGLLDVYPEMKKLLSFFENKI